jgi:hypothetical protein
VSTTSKGNYYRTRTKQWLESQGFDVTVCEVAQRVMRRDRRTGELSVIFLKHDLWGADLLASDGERLVVVQCKTHERDVARGLRELAQAPWPRLAGLDLWCVRWPPRRRLADGPDVHEVEATDI